MHQDQGFERFSQPMTPPAIPLGTESIKEPVKIAAEVSKPPRRRAHRPPTRKQTAPPTTPRRIATTGRALRVMAEQSPTTTNPKTATGPKSRMSSARGPRPALAKTIAAGTNTTASHIATPQIKARNLCIIYTVSLFRHHIPTTNVHQISSVSPWWNSGSVSTDCEALTSSAPASPSPSTASHRAVRSLPPRRQSCCAAARR